MESNEQKRLLGEFKRHISLYLQWLGYSERCPVDGDGKALASEAAERFFDAGLLALKGGKAGAQVVPRADVARMLGVTLRTVARYGELGYIRPVVREYSGRVKGYELESVTAYIEKYGKAKCDAGLLALKGGKAGAHVVPRAEVARMLGVTLRTVARYGKLGYIRPVVREYSGRVRGYELESVTAYLERYGKVK